MTGFDPLASDSPLIVYIDYKSPYAFLAVEPTYEIEDHFGIEIDWRPLTLDIPSYLGSARLDERGNVVEQDRTPEQWSGVKYACRDARRYAALRGSTLRGTVKIWDTSLAHIGMMWAKRQGHDVLRAYTRGVYLASGQGTDREAGRRPRHEYEDVLRRLREAGAIEAPAYFLGDEVFIGRAHLPMIERLLTGRAGPPPI